MDHTDTAETRHGDRHFAFSNSIHCRADKGDIQFDIAGKVTGNISIVREKIRILNHQRDVIESKPFKRERRHKFVDVTHDTITFRFCYFDYYTPYT